MEFKEFEKTILGKLFIGFVMLYGVFILCTLFYFLFQLIGIALFAVITFVSLAIFVMQFLKK